MRAAVVVALLLAGCGGADIEPTEPEPKLPRLGYICTDVIDGHKVTYYCEGKP
jgi:hypothetical protein